MDQRRDRALVADDGECFGGLPAGVRVAVFEPIAEPRNSDSPGDHEVDAGLVAYGALFVAKLVEQGVEALLGAFGSFGCGGHSCTSFTSVHPRARPWACAK